MKVWITFKSHYGFSTDPRKPGTTTTYSGVAVFAEELAAYRYAVEHSLQVQEMDFTEARWGRVAS